MTEVVVKSGEIHCGKRKRGEIILAELELASEEQRMARAGQLKAEMKGLVECYFLHQHCPIQLFEEAERLEEPSGDRGVGQEQLGRSRKAKTPKLESVVAQLVEGSNFTLKELVSVINGKLIAVPQLQPTSPALVRTIVLSIGHRVPYGISDSDADSLEDSTPSALWCWEIRDLKILPKPMRTSAKTQRAFCKSINERVTAISELIQALEKSELDAGFERDIIRALDKLSKVSPVRTYPQAPNANVAQPVPSSFDGEGVRKQELRDSINQAESQYKLQFELQKEALKQEKEQKRLLREAEKAEKLKKKEEIEKKKLMRKQQEEADKEQKQREKEEAELKKSNSIKKQVSIMERFIKRAKPAAVLSDNECSSLADPMVKKIDFSSDVTTQLMDKAFSSLCEIPIDEIRRVHVSSWRDLGHSLRLNNKQHWSIRRMPKVEYKELKLTTSKDPFEHESFEENLNTNWEDTVPTGKLSSENAKISNCDAKLCNRRQQLLQFDKSNRPAFYGIWPKQSTCIGPRHPFCKDPEIDYEIDSDEEWEEEEPGESLSDVDKDDEEALDQVCKADDEESEDGFFVPDGYLSENEGVHVDRMEVDVSSEVRNFSDKDQENDEFLILLKQQKFLNNLTECALRKNQPFIVNNMMQNKFPLLSSEGLTATQNLENTCLQTLCIRPFPGVTFISLAPIPHENSTVPNAGSTKVESLEANSITTPVLTNNVGKHMSTFFSKRCLPPTDEIGETSPETSLKTSFADQESPSSHQLHVFQ